MATKLTTEHDVKRQDTVKLVPEDVLLGRNSKVVPAVDYDDKVVAKALSIAKHGQLEPVLAHRDGDNRVVLDAGFTRRDAVILLRKGFSAVDPDDGETRTFHDPEARLWVHVDPTVKTAEEAFLRSVLENKEHDQVTDVQEGEAQKVLREEFGWTDARIARHYGYTNTNRVALLRRVVDGPDNIKHLVHAGKMAVSVADDLLRIADPTERAAVLGQASLSETGKVAGSLVRDGLRAWAEKAGETVENPVTHESSESPTVAENLSAADAGATTPPPEPKSAKKTGKKKGEIETPKSVTVRRNLKKFRDFRKDYENNTDYRAEVGNLFDKVIGWFDGKIGDKALYNAIDALPLKRG